jgi:multidrug efflux pump subunit AcrA (membrane-fusion protein)
MEKTLMRSHLARFTLLATAAAVVMLSGCRPRAARKAEETPIETSGLPVSVYTAARGTIDNRLTVCGSISPNEMVMAFPKVPGKLVENKVKEGQAVTKDEVLALVNQDQPGQDFKDHEVKSPISGIVAKVPMDPGSMVGPGVPVATVIDIENVKVTVNVIEADIGQVRIGQAADVTVPAYPDRTFHGAVSNVLPMVDQLSHTTKVEVTIPNPSHELKPGMSACASLKLGTHQNVVVIPRTAIIEKMDERFVYLFKDGTATRSSVTTGYRDDVNAEVLSGVNAGDRIVVSDLEVLKDGTRVQAKPDSAAGTGK